ncbi:hypothetical protein JOQ06_010142 [Pogonophryne albipinna]|uniref:Uncharacterized protein n=1 Tax=Pogonophryne albipinna TaxID=1090488 RepID=A0AAD6AWQ2_9TELE|nr:hypothetical protein JOQ06_010142 [Pogonophryne albipinna]
MKKKRRYKPSVPAIIMGNVRVLGNKMDELGVLTKTQWEYPLKRSFDIEDVDDIPSFSPASPISNPVSPSSSHFFLHHNKATHHSRISLSSSPSPVLKSRSVVNSMSFNRGTTNKPAIHNNGSSVTRAASFQSRLNPNGYSILSGPGSDNDSLHSSTSSLEYSGVGGGALPLTKPGSYHSPPPHGEYLRTQLAQQHRDGGVNLGSHPNLKNFPSHGGVFHQMDQGPRMMLGAPDPQGGSHGSMPSLNLQICDGGGGLVSMQRSVGGGMVSPGLRYANANWNGRLHNASSFGEEVYCGPKSPYQQQGPQVLRSPQPKAKEASRLNKFPLDLDSLVNSSSTTTYTNSPGGSMSPNPPKPPPRSTGSLQHYTSPPSTPASPSASLSSLDSSSDTPSLHHPFLPLTPRSQTFSEGFIPTPEIGSPVPLSPGYSPKLEILLQPQVVQVAPNVPNPSSPSRPRAVWSVEEGPGDARDSVGSILQRIASFSQNVTTDTTPAAVTQPPPAQSNGGFSSEFGSPAETTLMHPWKQEKKNLKELRMLFLASGANILKFVR